MKTSILIFILITRNKTSTSNVYILYVYKMYINIPQWHFNIPMHIGYVTLYFVDC